MQPHLTAAHADYELARSQLFCASARLAVASNRIGAWIHQTFALLGPDGLPGMVELLEEFRPFWAQLLLNYEVELSLDYWAAVLYYPFISDSCWTDSTTDEDLPILIDFLSYRAARAQQLTPPVEESLN